MTKHCENDYAEIPNLLGGEGGNKFAGAISKQDPN